MKIDGVLRYAIRAGRLLFLLFLALAWVKEYFTVDSLLSSFGPFGDCHPLLAQQPNLHAMSLGVYLFLNEALGESEAQSTSLACLSRVANMYYLHQRLYVVPLSEWRGSLGRCA